MIYLIILIVLLILTYKFDVCEQVNGRNISIYFVSFLLIIVAGFRYRIGLDTMRYMEYYDNIPSFNNLTFNHFILSQHEPLYFLIEVFAKTISSEFFVLQVIQSVFVNLVVINFFKKNTKYLFTAILFYYLILYISFNCEAMRSSMAVAIFLLSYPYLKEKRWVLYYIFAFLAMMFHTSAIALLIVPLFTRIKMNKFSILYLFAAFIIAFIVSENIKLILSQISVTDSLSRKADLYLNSNYSGQVLNIFGIISNLIMYVIIPYFVVRRLYKTNKQRLEYEYLILLCISVAILSIKVQIFERLLDYFMPFLLLALAEYLGAKIHSVTQNKLIKYYAMLYLFVFIFLKIYGQYFGNISGIYNYNRYLPYYTIFTKEKSPERESLYNKSYTGF